MKGLNNVIKTNVLKLIVGILYTQIKLVNIPTSK